MENLLLEMRRIEITHGADRNEEESWVLVETCEGRPDFLCGFIVLGLIVGASSKDKHEPAEVRASRPEPTAEERAANKAAADAARALLPKPAPTPAPTPKPTPKPTPTPEPQREIKWREISEIY